MQMSAMFCCGSDVSEIANDFFFKVDDGIVVVLINTDILSPRSIERPSSLMPSLRSSLNHILMMRSTVIQAATNSDP